MSELTKQLRKSFQDEEYRNAYAESFMNSYVAAQIKTLREENELTQEQLAAKIGTKQAGISRLENVNYSSWKVETLRKIARALNIRLKITFEEFGTLAGEIEAFRRKALLRLPFEKDPVFFPSSIATVVPISSSSLSRRELVAMQPPVDRVSQVYEQWENVCIGTGARFPSLHKLIDYPHIQYQFSRMPSIASYGGIFESSVGVLKMFPFQQQSLNLTADMYQTPA